VGEAAGENDGLAGETGARAMQMLGHMKVMMEYEDKDVEER
jgi:hypothetical protein